MTLLDPIRPYLWAIKLGLLAIAVLGVLAWGSARYHAGKADGVTQERIAWEEARRKLLAQLEEQRRAAQAKIDKLESDYLAGRQGDALAIADLEEQLRQKEQDDAKSGAGPRPPAIPGGVSKSLDKIGR